MATNFTINGGSPFKIKRPVITTSGFVSDVDATVKSHLDELNGILGRRIFKRESTREERVEEIAEKLGEQFVAELEEIQALPPGQSMTPPQVTIERSTVEPDIFELLSKPLSPKKIPDSNWVADSLVDAMKDVAESPDNITLSEYIDMTAPLSALKYEFLNNIQANWFNLGYNTKAVMDGYPEITDYLIAYGYHVMSLTDPSGLKNFILSNKSGAKNVADYAAVSAARYLIVKEQLIVPNYNEDNSQIVKAIKDAKVPLSATSFKKSVKAIINDFVFNSAESALIAAANIGPLAPGVKPLLIQYIKKFSATVVPITATNAPTFVPMLLSQIKGTTDIVEPTEVDTEESDKDFDVQFLEEDSSLIQVSKSAVKCAAQLYYTMVMGDELDVFNTVNYFTHKYLIRGGIEIQDSRLRQDLQNYVFSNRFEDLKTKKMVDRTRPAERQMFYTQVFNQGHGQATGDLIPNQEFQRLWKVLILESAKYLERAQASPNPDSYVSRQNVMQAVEDLQYNLSTHCTGMANVITPLIYAELNFVIQRIFMHKEVLRQVVPAGATWWRVVETLYMGMKNVRPKATVLYNKAKLGHDIIRSIADYNPATFEDDKNFAAFISNVDAFITTQSILQEALSDSLRQGDEEEEEDASQNGSGQPYMAKANAPSANGGQNGQDEWDF